MLQACYLSAAMHLKGTAGDDGTVGVIGSARGVASRGRRYASVTLLRPSARNRRVTHVGAALPDISAASWR